MSRRALNEIGSKLAIVATAALVTVAPFAAAAQQSMYDVDFSLEDGENSRDWTFRFDDPHIAVLNGRISSHAVVIDAAIEPKCRSRFELRVVGRSGEVETNVHRGPVFRRVFPGAPYTFELDPIRVNTDVDYLESPQLRECEVTVRVYRPANVCTMSAQVNGDLSGTYFGDFAYFNYFKDGAPITTSNVMDPATVAMMDQLMGVSAGNVAAMGGDQTELSPVDEDGPKTWDEVMRQWAAESDDLPAGVGDKFGISLNDLKPETGGIVGTPIPQDSYDNTLKGAEAFGSALMGLSAFSLTASAPGDELMDELASATEADTFLTERVVPLSRVDFIPGGYKDANFEGIKFLWEAGDPGSATLKLVSPAPNVLWGVLEANLLSEKRYENGRVSIALRATFQALRGAYSCNRQ